MQKSNKTVMTFGSFDHLHEGHRNFLKDSLKQGDELIVVVAREEAVFEIKGKRPLHSLEKRIENIKKEKIAGEVIPGDEVQNSWEVLKKYKPDVIALGYDQKQLRDTLLKILPSLDFTPEIITIPPHKPEEYHSRFVKNPRDTIRLSGKVERGKGEANILGFPTINLPLNIEHPSGIYAGKVHIHGIEYKAAIYVGPEKDIIEAHIIDFKEKDELYNEWAVIEIEQKIRDVVTSKSLQEMKELIAKDVEKIKFLL
ncbi:MAG: FAD synthetase [Parcubacteria group bacterium Gr01-1014_107]|nr:MAG: FAD synthetase [Parcubacteria group bacterium Gr01-1014_107]